jgi:hypothetical protein
VPLGGTVTVTVAFYDLSNQLVGAGSIGPAPNVIGSPLSITITEYALPLGPGVTYSHKQKTVLDSNGNHLWACASAPVAPASQSACQPSPGNICAFRDITYNPTQGYLGYAWQSYTQAACESGGQGQLDQVANIPGVNGNGGNAQAGYTATSCGLQSETKVTYDPLGRAGANYYLDTHLYQANPNSPSAIRYVLRQINLNPPSIPRPGSNVSWGAFNFSADDLLLHPAGAVVSLNTALNKMESLTLQAAATTDDDASANRLANVHGGLGTRPGLFSSPTVATINADGVILIVEAGNNRIHAIDVSGNPVRHFTKQPEQYFLYLTETASPGTNYLDIAVEFGGFIYVLSENNLVFRLDIYSPDQNGTSPVTTTMGVNAAKLTVDYFRNVYTLNYEVLMENGVLPSNGVTEPSISQWIPTQPPPCETVVLPSHKPRLLAPRREPTRLLRRRDLWQRE